MPLWPESDQTKNLLEQAKQGEETAVNRLMDRHRDSLRRLVQMRLDRKIQQRVDVSDIVQDVLVEANRRLKDYLHDGTMPFHLWLRHIARDRIIDAHRRHRASAKRSVDREFKLAVPSGQDQSSIQLAAQLGDQRITPAAAALQKELVAHVEGMMSKLDEADCEVIVMRHYEQLTNQEVAQALGLTEPAASMRYLRAVRKLRALMNGEEAEGN